MTKPVLDYPCIVCGRNAAGSYVEMLPGTYTPIHPVCYTEHRTYHPYPAFVVPIGEPDPYVLQES